MGRPPDCWLQTCFLIDTSRFSHIGVGERFRRFVAAAKANDGQFDLTAGGCLGIAWEGRAHTADTLVKKLFEQNVKLSIANNPDFFLDGFVLGGNLGAVSLLMSSGILAHI